MLSKEELDTLEAIKQRLAAKSEGNQMYERFTDRARSVMQLAQQEAMRLCHEFIGTEHVLLGIVKEGSGIGAAVLRECCGMDSISTVRGAVLIMATAGPDKVVMGQLPQTPAVKKVLQFACEEASNFHHNHVGTEHLLLGLLREGEGIAAQVLANAGLTLEMARKGVLDVIGAGMDDNGPKKTAEEKMQAFAWSVGVGPTTFHAPAGMAMKVERVDWEAQLLSLFDKLVAKCVSVDVAAQMATIFVDGLMRFPPPLMVQYGPEEKAHFLIHCGNCGTVFPHERCVHDKSATCSKCLFVNKPKPVPEGGCECRRGQLPE